jgi:hypothetical protein
MANYLGTLIQRMQAAAPAIRPVVAPLFAPNANALDLSTETTPFSLEEDVSPTAESNAPRARRASRSKGRAAATTNQIEEASPQPERQRLGRNASAQIVADGPASARPPVTSNQLGPNRESNGSVSTLESAKSIARIETRTIERVTQTGVPSAQSGVKSQPIGQETGVSTTEQPRPSDPVRPRIDPFVPAPSASLERRRSDAAEAESSPTIRVTIGRVDVKLVAAEGAKRPVVTKPESKPTLALENYLARPGDRQ